MAGDNGTQDKPEKRSRWRSLGGIERIVAVTLAVLGLPAAAVGAWKVLEGSRNDDVVRQQLKPRRRSERVSGCTE
jgi:hypothetical protein